MYTSINDLHKPHKTIIYIYLTPLTQAGYDIRSISKWSKAGLTSKFSYSYTGCLTMAKVCLKFKTTLQGEIFA